jgi:hypothetical protein
VRIVPTSLKLEKLMYTRFKLKSGSILAALSAISLLPIAAYASPPCTKEPKTAWLSEAKMKEKVATMGYREIKVFKTSGSCYEIYAIDSKGHKAEVYFNPVDGSVVQSNVD